MEVANAQAHYDMATITVVKSFIVQAPGLALGAVTEALNIESQMIITSVSMKKTDTISPK
jgi:hypothetical protein